MNKSEISIKNISEIPEYARNFLDGKLYTEDTCSFEINKTVLARKSLYFEMLFYGSFCNKSEFLIPGIKGECLHEILQYFYTGKISLNSENVIDIMKAAHDLIITDLVTVVRENVNQTLTIDNSFQLLTLSDSLNDTAVYQESYRYTQLHFEELMRAQRDDFTNISFEILKSLLSAKNLSIDSESSVWLAIKTWTEKCKSERKRLVPCLLVCLALEDLDENSATEIMEHDLIVNNSHVKKLNPSDYPSNHDLLKSMVLNTHLMKDIFKSRIPPEIHIIGVMENYHSYQLYITYDENLDVWRKICDINVPFLQKRLFLYNIQNQLYVFYFMGNWKIDLRNGVTVWNNFHINFLSIAQIKNKLYFLYTVTSNLVTTCKFKIYDCNINSWTENTQIFNMDYGQCVSIDESIYVVGRIKNSGVMTAYVYDTTPPGWFDFRALLFPQSRVKKLPSPAVFRCSDFQVVAYRQKIFVLGGGSWLQGIDNWKNLRRVEAFDVESHTWNQLEDLPFSYCFLYEIYAIVLNDRLFVYESSPSYETSSNIAVWNDDLEKWVRLEVKDDLVTTPKWDREGFEMPISSIRKIRQQEKKSRLYHDFCTIKDKDVISAVCRANRKLPFVRSRFSEKDTFQQDWFGKQ